MELTHKDLLNEQHRKVAAEATEKIRRLTGYYALKQTEPEEDANEQ